MPLQAPALDEFSDSNSTPLFTPCGQMHGKERQAILCCDVQDLFEERLGGHVWHYSFSMLLGVALHSTYFATKSG